MIVVFVGSNPSKKNMDPLVPFDGTVSGNRLGTWTKYMKQSAYICVNVSDRIDATSFTSSELDQLRDIVNQVQEGAVLVALGIRVSRALQTVSVDHFPLPHPSGRNRQLNKKNPQYVQARLDACALYIKERASR